MCRCCKILHEMSPSKLALGGAGAQQVLPARRRRGQRGGLRRSAGAALGGAAAPGLGRRHLRAARQPGADGVATGRNGQRTTGGKGGTRWYW